MPGRPLIFGEVLFDHFPDGTEALGGAPVNVAWHLQGFGLRPVLVSRVGDDEQGRRVIDKMSGWGMDLTALQIDDRHSTGQVRVSLRDGQPEFDIVADQAYDFIDGEMARAAVASVGARLFYHGTLALRNDCSRNAFSCLSALPELKRCVDVNLRPPWTPLETVREVLGGASWVKVNDLELQEITGCAPESLSEGAHALKARYGLDQLIVTRGEAGASLYVGDTVRHGAPVPVTDLKDTVGAGDAFSSVALLGLALEWKHSDTLDRALEFASLVCGIRGATISDPVVYRRCLERWGT
ncbi:MAG: carbohydrate kinase [Gammaproteobacteria bacterium]|nr:carbohydrate kinase [Gammaproteobacteria bacterium]